MKLIPLLLLASCAKPTVEPAPTMPDRLELVKSKVAELQDEARSLMDKDGLAIQDQCDAPLWNGKLATALPSEVNLEAYEQEESGKFCRTKDCICYPNERSGSSWSRDMSLGMLSGLFAQGNLGAIERHIAYGDKRGWVMGEGAPSRTVYSPALISLWYKAARLLGRDYGYVEVGNAYPPGLDDFEAHLQMMNVYLNGEMDGAITGTMLARISEHSERLPSIRFYRSLKEKWDETFSASIDLCLDDNHIDGDYVRCSEQDCELVERLFVCNYILSSLEE